MAANFETSDPNKLLAAFKKAIDDKRIVTWSYDEDGDFTHVPDQWKGKAWMRPSVFNGRLVMNFVGNNSLVTTWDVYGVYHGRFVESMITHCHDLFSVGAATATPTNSDQITTKAA